MVCAPGFLKSFLFARRNVCVFVCPSLIISVVIWCDIGHDMLLVKPVLLLLINWKGVALVTQCTVHARKDVKVDTVLATEGDV